MKKYYLLFSFIHLVLFSALCQSPQAFKYQAVARDASGEIVANQAIGVKFSIYIMQAGTPVLTYAETHALTTNEFGIFNAEVGNGTVLGGTFEGIDWSYPDDHLLRVAIDITGGSNYVTIGNSQLLSVPYALYAERGGDEYTAGTGITINASNVISANDVSPTNEIQNLSVAGNNLSITGGNTVALPTELPSGTSGYTLRHNGTSWISNNVIFNNGTNIGIGTTSPPAKLTLNNGSLLAAGTTGETPFSGSGARMMWVPAKRSFRAGMVTGTNWDNDSLGSYSVAFGYNTKASGMYSSAFGNAAFATSNYATSMGYNSLASGSASFTAGYSTEATGNYSAALGNNCVASGVSSFAVGSNTEALANYSSSFGLYSDATGNYSTVFGDHSTSQSYASLVIGKYNVLAGSTDTWVAGDPIFVVGNGVSTTGRSNAFTILKDGRTGIGDSDPAYMLVVNNSLFNRALYMNNTYNGASTKYGIYNMTSEEGSSLRYGIYNYVYGNSTSSSAVHGTYTYVNPNSCTGTVYGVYSNVSNSGTGNHYAVFASAEGGWAGYFSNGDVCVLDAMCVGTSTIPTGYKFAVDGKVICEEIKVQLSEAWPDYVFNPGYKLLPLKELEQSINTNHHLPGLPPASVVEAEGMNLSEMTTRLTAKIEELTLYMIELNHKVEALQQENEMLKKQIPIR